MDDEDAKLCVDPRHIPVPMELSGRVVAPVLARLGWGRITIFTSQIGTLHLRTMSFVAHEVMT
jgi:hypothetical protein